MRTRVRQRPAQPSGDGEVQTSADSLSQHSDVLEEVDSRRLQGGPQLRRWLQAMIAGHLDRMAMLVILIHINGGEAEFYGTR